jgi:acyl-CoA reductase-like NAD-dependent aldehyde dehydrogenase
LLFFYDLLIFFASEDTPLSALALAALSQLAGLPPGVLNVVPCSRERVAAVGGALTQHPKASLIHSRELIDTGQDSIPIGAW